MLRFANFLCLAVCCFLVPVLYGASEAEISALQALFDSTRGSSKWTLNTNWGTGDPCSDSWYGVTCENGVNVSEIDLAENGLFGELPASLINLSNLEVLNLNSNKLSGTLPPEWTSFAHLEEIYLSNNKYSGSLPPEWSSLISLRSIKLETTHISGTLPIAWSTLTNLHILDLNGNSVKGALYPQWSTLTQLEEFDITDNTFTGTLPPSWNTMKNMKSFEVSGNKIQGVLPSAWSSMTKLEKFIASGNAISGTLPPEWVSFKSLDEMDVSFNQIGGSFPSSWLAISKKMFASENSLTGVLPKTPAPAWEEFDLTGNEFYCSLPSWCKKEGENFCSTNNFCVSPSITQTQSTSSNDDQTQSISSSSNDDNDDGDDEDDDVPSTTLSTQSESISATRSPSVGPITESASNSQPEPITESASNSQQSESPSRSVLRSRFLLGPTAGPIPTHIGKDYSPSGYETHKPTASASGAPTRSGQFQTPTGGGSLPVGKVPINVNDGNKEKGVSVSIDTGTGFPVDVNVAFPEDYPRDPRIVSRVMDITLVNEMDTFDLAHFCFSPTRKSGENKCLGYYDTERQEWVCEDPCLEENSEGQVCGSTRHFTSFALLLRGSATKEDECGSPIYDYVTGTLEGDMVLVFVLIGTAVLFVTLAVLLSNTRFFAPHVFGSEGHRISRVRHKYKSYKSRTPSDPLDLESL